MTDIHKEVEKMVAWTCDFLEDNESFDVLPQMEPGQIYNNLEKSAPAKGKPLDNIFEEFKEQILPGITHWNHPGFSAYFNSSAGTPSVFAEMLSAAINTNVMLWKASPSGTEVEQKTLEWLQEMLGLSGFTGITYDGGSTSSFHALAAMREAKLGADYRQKGLMAMANINPRLYVSEQTHNSIHKAIITLGFGTDSISTVDIKDDYSMDAAALEKQIIEDKAAGFTPLCAIATLGTTSCTAIDPAGEMSKVCRKHGLWLHIDAAHGGTAAILEEIQE
ncbi:MAG: PLP-dependent decarboxylase, partial [Desulfobacteraceae bacterium]|nr:PLP-dependent decarboxylase [Desulfobacteraceae bacterium]